MSSSKLTKRNNYKWNVNEILSLQREYELQELTIQEIALLHKRSVFSILNKLEKEQIIVNFNDARGYDNLNFWDNDDNDHGEDEDEDEDEYENEDENEHEHEDEHEDEDEDEDEDENEHEDEDEDEEEDEDEDKDVEDHQLNNEIISTHTQNIDDIDVVYFEDELMKKVKSANNKKRYENMTLFDIVYELTERIERLEDKIVSIETANSNANANANSLLIFIKNWFYAKRIC